MIAKRIEQWNILAIGKEFRLVGNVYGQEDISDGTRVQTSPIEGIKPLDELIITRSKDEYSLGDPCPELEQECPGAREHVLELICEEVVKAWKEEKRQLLERKKPNHIKRVVTKLDDPWPAEPRQTVVKRLPVKEKGFFTTTLEAIGTFIEKLAGGYIKFY